MTEEKQTVEENKVVSVFELHEMIKEIALAHDNLVVEVKRLSSMLASHQHSSQGNALFPLEE